MKTLSEEDSRAGQALSSISLPALARPASRLRQEARRCHPRSERPERVREHPSHTLDHSPARQVPLRLWTIAVPRPRTAAGREPPVTSPPDQARSHRPVITGIRERLAGLQFLFVDRSLVDPAQATVDRWYRRVKPSAARPRLNIRSVSGSGTVVWSTISSPGPPIVLLKAPKSSFANPVVTNE